MTKKDRYIKTGCRVLAYKWDGTDDETVKKEIPKCYSGEYIDEDTKEMMKCDKCGVSMDQHGWTDLRNGFHARVCVGDWVTEREDGYREVYEDADFPRFYELDTEEETENISGTHEEWLKNWHTPKEIYLGKLYPIVWVDDKKLTGNSYIAECYVDGCLPNFPLIGFGLSPREAYYDLKNSYKEFVDFKNS
jgi:hypothetical protein